MKNTNTKIQKCTSVFSMLTIKGGVVKTWPSARVWSRTGPAMMMVNDDYSDFDDFEMMVGDTIPALPVEICVWTWSLII